MFMAFAGPARGRKPEQSVLPTAGPCAARRGNHQSTPHHDCFAVMGGGDLELTAFVKGT